MERQNVERRENVEIVEEIGTETIRAAILVGAHRTPSKSGVFGMRTANSSRTLEIREHAQFHKWDVANLQMC